jgi:hypothetical protein
MSTKITYVQVLLFLRLEQQRSRHNSNQLNKLFFIRTPVSVIVAGAMECEKRDGLVAPLHC